MEAVEPSEDPDRDEDGDLDVEHYPIPQELLDAAGISTDEEWQKLLDEE